jgi:hypothetical protein
MNAPKLAATRRSVTLAAIALAVVVGVVSLVAITGRQADAEAATTVVPAAPVPADTIAPAIDDAGASLAATVDAAAAPSASLPAGMTALPSDGTAPADPALADDPLAGVIVEAVDPAEALFGEQSTAVATSN